MSESTLRATARRIKLSGDEYLSSEIEQAADDIKELHQQLKETVAFIKRIKTYWDVYGFSGKGHEFMGEDILAFLEKMEKRDIGDIENELKVAKVDLGILRKQLDETMQYVGHKSRCGLPIEYHTPEDRECTCGFEAYIEKMEKV